MSDDNHDQEGAIVSPDTRRSERIPPGQVETRQWPVLHWGGVPRIELGRWRLRIDGLVEQPWECDWPTFQTLPRVRVFCDIHCVTTWSRLDNLFEGPSTREVLSRVKVRPEARFVVLHAYEGSGGPWSTNLPLDAFIDDDCLFAVVHNREALTPHHGGPCRIVVPKLYFWKSAKWIRRVELTDKDRPGFWERNGYHMHGDPWKEERYG